MDILTDVQGTGTEATKADLLRLLNKLTSARKVLLVMNDIDNYELTDKEYGQIVTALIDTHGMSKEQIVLEQWAQQS